jgi:hypothetical protein
MHSMPIARVPTVADGVIVIGVDGEAVGPFDEVTGATGFSPDLDVTRAAAGSRPFDRSSGGVGAAN